MLRAASAVEVRDALAALGKAGAGDLDSVFHDRHAVVSVPLAREQELRSLIVREGCATLAGVGPGWSCSRRSDFRSRWPGNERHAWHRPHSDRDRIRRHDA